MIYYGAILHVEYPIVNRERSVRSESQRQWGEFISDANAFRSVVDAVYANGVIREDGEAEAVPFRRTANLVGRKRGDVVVVEAVQGVSGVGGWVGFVSGNGRVGCGELFFLLQMGGRDWRRGGS